MNLNSPEAILAVLATAGISFCLPAVYAMDDEMVDTIKETFSEELNAYKIYLDEKIGQVRSGLGDGEANFDDVWEYANAHIVQGLQLRAEAIEIAVSKSGKQVKKGLIDGVKGGTPEIVSALVTGNFPAMGKGILKVLFSGLSSGKAYEEMRKQYPEAAYLYQIRKKVQG